MTIWIKDCNKFREGSTKDNLWVCVCTEVESNLEFKSTRFNRNNIISTTDNKNIGKKRSWRFHYERKVKQRIWKEGCACSVTSVLSDSATLWTVAHQTPGFSRQKILERVAMTPSMGPSWPRDWTRVSSTAGRVFTAEPLGKSMKRRVASVTFLGTKKQ